MELIALVVNAQPLPASLFHVVPSDRPRRHRSPIFPCEYVHQNITPIHPRRWAVARDALLSHWPPTFLLIPVLRAAKMNLGLPQFLRASSLGFQVPG